MMFKLRVKSLYSMLSVLIIVLSLLTSCIDDTDIFPSSQSEKTTLALSFLVNGESEQTTRTLSINNESLINDVTVLVFDNSHQLIGRTFVSGSTSATLAVDPATGCTVYAIANTGDASHLSGATTIENLNSMYVMIPNAASLGSESTCTIMAGDTSGVNISAGTNSFNVNIKHQCSKINFSIIPNSDITVTGYQLCHVPLSSYVTDSHESATVAPGGSYGDFDSTVIGNPVAGTTITSDTHYVYENLAGNISSCTTAALRDSSRAPSHATYLLIYAGTGSWRSIYRIYLGGINNSGINDYTDFNVYRNYNYIYTIKITGPGPNDARVSTNYDLQTDPGTGSWSSSGDVSTTPGTGNWSSAIDVQINPQTGSWSSATDVVIRPGTGNWSPSSDVSTKPSTGNWSPSSDVATKPSTGRWSPSSDVATKPSTGRWSSTSDVATKPSTGRWSSTSDAATKPNTGSWSSTSDVSTKPNTGRWSSTNDVSTKPNTGSWSSTSDAATKPNTGSWSSTSDVQSGTQIGSWSSASDSSNNDTWGN